MKRSTALVAALTTSALATIALAPLTAAAQDMAVTGGNMVKVLLENDKVRVLQVELPPGAKTGMHSHGDNIVYFEVDSEAKQTNADGTSKVMKRKAGEAIWSEPVTHDTENIGKTPTKALVIELKGATAAPEKEPVAKEPTKD